MERYKLTITVHDDTGTASFLMWDKESKELVGKTATEVSADPYADDPFAEGIPLEVQKLAHKKALFNITVLPEQTRNYTGTYSVARVSRDREIIQKLCGPVLFDYEEDESVQTNEVPKLKEMVGSSSSSKSTVDGIQKEEMIVKTIKQLLEDGQSGQFWIHATIHCIDTINQMSYLVCKKCLEELNPIDELKFFCEKCQSFDITGKSRYKFTVEVVDESGGTKFIIWDKEALEIIGIDKEESDVNREALLLKMEKTLLLKLEDLVNKKAMFKVIVLPNQIVNFEGPFTVVQVRVDEMIFEKISKNEETPISKKRGKEPMNDNMDEPRDDGGDDTNAMKTPTKLTIKSNDEATSPITSDSMEKTLIDEFSTTTKKRFKRLAKKEK